MNLLDRLRAGRLGRSGHDLLSAGHDWHRAPGAGHDAIGAARAGLFYAVNPFVFDRLYAGQLGVLLGYAALPFAADALLGAARSRRWPGRLAGAR